MKLMLKRFGCFLMAMMLLVSMATAISAADTQVIFKNESDGFVFLDGSNAVTKDLFENFKNAMPGDSLKQTVVIRNDDTAMDRVKVYFRAIPHDETANPLSPDVAAVEESVASMEDFLSQLSLTVMQEGVVLYHGAPVTPNDHDDSGNYIYLGTLNNHEYTKLDVTLDIPATLDNKYANRMGEVDWEFLVEEQYGMILPTKASVTFNAIKTVNGAAAVGSDYTFVLTDEAGNVIEEVNNSNGSVTFKTVRIGKEGTFVYYMTEKAGSDPETVYDSSVYKYTVVVTRPDRINYEATVTCEKDGVAYSGTPLFQNIKSGAAVTSAAVQLQAVKTVNGVTASGSDYTFVLTDAAGNVVEEVKNNDGDITFKALSFNAEGSYVYYMTEKAGSDSAVTYDSSSYKITIQVTRTAVGYAADVVIEKNGEVYTGVPVFQNIKRDPQVQPDPTSVTLTAVKTVNGATAVGSEYTFVLKDAAGNLVEEVKNDGGNVKFKTLTFNTAGSYVYYMTEKAGADLAVTYDTASYKITIDVTNVEGSFAVNVATEKDGAAFEGTPVFQNTRTEPKPAAPASVTLTATKTVDGHMATGSEYTFLLKDEAGNVLQTKQNDEAFVVFDALTFDKEGTFVYTISEQKGTDSTMIYDTTTYKVTVKVTKGENYTAAVTYEKNGEAYDDQLLFANKHVEDPDIPKTGDETDIFFYVAMFTVGVVIIIMLILTARKTKKVRE